MLDELFREYRPIAEITFYLFSNFVLLPNYPMDFGYDRYLSYSHEYRPLWFLNFYALIVLEYTLSLQITIYGGGILLILIPVNSSISESSSVDDLTLNI